jgi:undecaprenyl-diphosphatase
MLIAALSAYATIAFFVSLVARVGMMPFVIYRIFLAMVLFLIVVFV